MSGDRDMQNLMAARPDAHASVDGPALAHQLERIATALEALAARRPSISTRPSRSAGAVSTAGRARRRSNRSRRPR